MARKRYFPKTVLFVCHGNRNRSPTGEKVFKDMLKQRGYIPYEFSTLKTHDVYVSSAGTCADESDHANQLDKELANSQDIIFALDDYIQRVLIETYCQPRKKIINLGIPDIYGRNSPDLVKKLEELLTPYMDKWYPQARG